MIFSVENIASASQDRRPVGPPSPSLLALRLREGVHPLVQLQLCSTVIVLIEGEKHLVMMSSWGSEGKVRTLQLDEFWASAWRASRSNWVLHTRNTRGPIPCRWTRTPDTWSETSRWLFADSIWMREQTGTDIIESPTEAELCKGLVST